MGMFSVFTNIVAVEMSNFAAQGGNGSLPSDGNGNMSSMNGNGGAMEGSFAPPAMGAGNEPSKTLW